MITHNHGVTATLWSICHFGPVVVPVVAGVDAAPEIAEATRDWSRCMAELGYNFESYEAATSYFRDRNQQVRMAT